MREKIQSRRLLLRVPRLADAEFIEALACDRCIARMVSTMPHPYPPGGARKWIALMRQMRGAGTSYTYVIERAEKIVGAISAGGREDSAALELGYWVGRPYWGQGIASEAARAMIDAYFEDLSFDALTSSCFQDNPGSERVIRKSGFIETVAGTRWCEARGLMVPSRNFAISRVAWRGLRAEAVS